jgi:hypothetical protein
MMQPIKNEFVKAERLTNDDAHYFYGYYDTPAWSGNDRYHLCHQVQFCNRIPHTEDRAILGYIDTQDRSFHRIGETTAWNFQQGSMLQWHPVHSDEVVIYNARKRDEYEGIVQNISTGASKQLELPVASVDPTGTYAASINFDRLYDFRPGYGYAGRGDRFKDSSHPADDGIFLIDLTSGISRLVLSLQQIWEFTKAYFGGKDRKLLVNHITFNTDGSRLVFLARYFPDSGESWETAVLTCNYDGSDLFLLSDYAYASHYHWRDREHLVIHSRGAEVSHSGNQLYELKDKAYVGHSIDEAFFVKDGHCSYSPDRRYMLYDSYPDADHYRSLFLYHLSERRGIVLGSYYSQPELDGDIRCDLHPRWNRQGNRISFDSTHEGSRAIYIADIQRVL